MTNQDELPKKTNYALDAWHLDHQHQTPLSTEDHPKFPGLFANPVSFDRAVIVAKDRGSYRGILLDHQLSVDELKAIAAYLKTEGLTATQKPVGVSNLPPERKQYHLFIERLQ